MDGSARLQSEAAPAPIPQRYAHIERGTRFLNEQYSASSGFPSYISTDTRFEERVLAPTEIFSSMLILACLTESETEMDFQRHLLEKVLQAFTPEGFVHFFERRELLPADIDCTSVALDLVLKHGRAVPFQVHGALDRIAANVNQRGVLRVYLNARGRRADRVDAAACVNALYAFSLVRREADLEATIRYVDRHLSTNRFFRGTRYYPSPDILLLFLSRLMRDFEWARLRFGDTVYRRLEQRRAIEGSTVLDLGARAAAADNLGLFAEAELRELASLQRPDGSWAAAPCFKFGRTHRFFGGESMSTALAIRALMSGSARSYPRMQTWRPPRAATG